MSTIITIAAGDLPTNSRADLNTNFSNLNTDKIETSVLDTDTTLAANSDAKIATQKAVKTYIDTSGGANASETTRGIVEEATDAEVTAGTATGGTGAKLFVTPAKLATRLTGITNPVVFVYTANDTWTKPSGLKYVVVEVCGGGGGGGGNTTSSTASAGGGGGGYSKKTIAVGSLGATETVTVGAGGSAGSATGGTGGTGGTSSFGAHAQATGGAGGTEGASGGVGGVGSIGNININGGGGGGGASSASASGTGGASFYGGGAAGVGGSAGSINAGVYGGGGGGALSSGGDSVGGTGGAGVVIVTEYYS